MPGARSNPLISSYVTRSRTRDRTRNANEEGTRTVPDSVHEDSEDEPIDVERVDVDENVVNNGAPQDIDISDEVIVEPAIPPLSQSRVALSSLASFMFSQSLGRNGDMASSSSGNRDPLADEDHDEEVLYVGASPDRNSSPGEVIVIDDDDDVEELIIPDAPLGGGWLEASQPDRPQSSPLVSSSNNLALPEAGQNVNPPRESSRRRNPDLPGVSPEFEESDGEESRSPPQKIPRLNTSVRSEGDEDGFNCQICYEPFTNSGNHRVCCLKCGHIYGKECIERWIHSSKRCPSCNCKATKRDIRVLYVKNIRAADTAELDRLKEEVDRVNIEKNKIELRNAQYRTKEEIQAREITRLNQQIALLRQRQPEVIDIAEAGPSSRALSDSTLHNQTLSSRTSGYLRMPRLQLMKQFEIKEGQSRVGTCNDWLNLLVVSHSIKSSLYPGGSFGIRKFNTLDMKPFQSFPIHQKALRDMSFSSLQTDLLLTVGLDKKAVLFNCNSNCPVQTFTTPNPLWSCCWNKVNQNIFYVGSVNGLVTSYDIRAPQEPVGNLNILSTDKGGVGSLKFVPPSYQNQSFNMSGLLIQKMNSVWFAEMLGGSASDAPRYHALPLEGPFVSADFEEESRHVLVSSRPKVTTGPNKVGTSHVVCTLGKTYSTSEERDLFSCDVIQSFHGGFQESSILCRSSIFSPRQGQVYVAANGESPKTVRVWDIANTEQKTMLRISHDAALDIVPGKVNETKFLGIISDKLTDVYEVK